MSNRCGKRGVILLASTSVLALGLAAAPVTVDFDLSQPMLKMAQAESGSSCFTGETAILMADGQERPVREVRVGDLVMAADGGANRVTGIERPVLGERLLYALNGGPHFVTAEHPFMTAAGWRAVDPAATAAENPKLAVARLTPGDCLTVVRTPSAPTTMGNLALAGLVLEQIVLVHLNAQAADPATPLFNLLLDGDHAYFAEGYLVHNKGGDDGGDSDGGDSDGGDDEHGGDEHGDDEHGDDEHGDDEHGDDDEHGEDDDEDDSVPPSFFGGLEQVGPDLDEDQERDTISKGWQ